MKGKHWKAAEVAVTGADLLEIQLEITGGGRSGKDALFIMLEADGTIIARMGEEVYRVVGMLNTYDEDDQTVMAAVDRIYNKSGMFRR